MSNQNIDVRFECGIGADLVKDVCRYLFQSVICLHIVAEFRAVFASRISHERYCPRISNDNFTREDNRSVS